MERRAEPPEESLADAGAGWFRDHHERAAQEILDFLAGDDISIAGRRVADIGCGDGVLDLGLVQHGAPGELVGFDIVPTDTEILLGRARGFGVAEQLPPQLVFRHSEAERIPARDASFDVVISWSAFEHVADVRAVLAEARRILRADGIFFLQLWPFYHSSHGSHLWEWCPEPYHHLVEAPEETERRVRASGRNPDFAEMMLREFRTLNRLTLDGLGEALLASGLAVRKLELLTESSHVPPAALRHPLSALGTSGVKLLATPLQDEEGRLLRVASPDGDAIRRAGARLGRAARRVRSRARRGG